MKKITLMILAVTLLGGCQQVAQKQHEYIRNRSKDYLSSMVIPPLQVPSELAHPVSTENFPVPERLPPIGSLAAVSLVPPGFGEMSESISMLQEG